MIDCDWHRMEFKGDTKSNRRNKISVSMSVSVNIKKGRSDGMWWFPEWCFLRQSGGVDGHEFTDWVWQWLWLWQWLWQWHKLDVGKLCCLLTVLIISESTAGYWAVSAWPGMFDVTEQILSFLSQSLSFCTHALKLRVQSVTWMEALRMVIWNLMISILRFQVLQWHSREEGTQ